MNVRTSSGSLTPSTSDFLSRMAILVSRSGGWISAISPHSNRDRSRSSRPGMSFGGESLEITICFWCVCSSLKVWKNSSCVRSLFPSSWMSSISSTSASRYRWWNCCMRSVRMQAIISFMNFSLEV